MLLFDTFAIDPARHVLTRHGDAVPLSPHLVDILAHLASHPGELVSKEALLDRFWPGINVTDNTLARAIADIRRALGDEAGAPRYIQTIARRGYRFIGEAVTAPAEPEDPLRNFVRARQAIESLSATKLPEALQGFEQAVAGMPDYAPAHAGLASACFLAYESTRAANTPDREPLRRAVAHASPSAGSSSHARRAWATARRSGSRSGVLAARVDSYARKQALASPACAGA